MTSGPAGEPPTAPSHELRRTVIETAIFGAVVILLAWLTGQFTTLFAWPAGIVVGNLIASVIWATPAFLHLHRKIDRNHNAHMALMRHHHEQVKQMLSAGAGADTGPA